MEDRIPPHANAVEVGFYKTNVELVSLRCVYGESPTRASAVGQTQCPFSEKLHLYLADL